MASAGIRKTPTGRYKVWWRLDDGTQGAKTFDTRSLARDFKNELLAQVAADSWTDPHRGRILFDEWANHWWQLWASSPRRSPKGMKTTESHLRCHLRPHLRPPAATPDHPLDRAPLATRVGGQAEPQRGDGVPVHPAAHPGSGPPRTPDPHQPRRDVEAPRPRINPERIFGHQRRRTFTPEEFGRFLAACRPFYRDHFLAHGTGLRSGELLGLRRRRVFPELRRIEVIEVRYEAGRFGRGFKAEPKSPPTGPRACGSRWRSYRRRCWASSG
jgi:integrase